MRKLTSNRFAIVIGAIFLFSALQAGLTFSIHSLLQGNTPGMDYYTFWTAGRTILMDQESPYSDQVALQSQLGILNRPSRPDEDQMGFAYPLYALLPILPSLIFSFDWAQPFWLAFNILALTTSLFVVFPRNPIRALMLTLPFYPLTFALILGNLNILVMSITTLAVGWLFFGRGTNAAFQIVLGFLLAWATCKPQFVFFFLALIAIYTFREKLKILQISFLISMMLLIAMATIAWPSWMGEWLLRVKSYSAYIPTQPGLWMLLQKFLPGLPAFVIASILAIIIALLTVWMSWNWWYQKISSLHILAWVGFISYISMPYSVSYEQLRFFIPLLFWLVLSPRKNITWWIFGLGTVLLSWAVFVLARFNPQLPAIDDIRFLFFLFWLLWLFLQTNFLHHKRGVNLESLPG